jgi:hypothetical protein
VRYVVEVVGKGGSGLGDIVVNDMLSLLCLTTKYSHSEQHETPQGSLERCMMDIGDAQDIQSSHAVLGQSPKECIAHFDRQVR